VLVLDEPTNDLDMETLDLLEDMLGDFEGTLILVSHDRDFIDRLATSTIALDGRGQAVETPGGWQDFLSQNPDFLAPPPIPVTSARPAQAASRTASAPAKLSFKDQRRLAEAEALTVSLPEEIARWERTLADPDLYARDPSAFARATQALERARSQLAAAEEAWLELEARREALAGR
jgi:ABC transport system ATP-binding/permease protein